MKTKIVGVMKFLACALAEIALVLGVTIFLVALILPVLAKLNWSEAFGISVHYPSVLAFGAAFLIVGLVASSSARKFLPDTRQKLGLNWRGYALQAALFVPLEVALFWFIIASSILQQRTIDAINLHSGINEKWKAAENTGSFPCAENLSWFDGLEASNDLFSPLLRRIEVGFLYRNGCIDEKGLFSRMNELEAQSLQLRDRFADVWHFNDSMYHSAVFREPEWCMIKSEKEGLNFGDAQKRCFDESISNSKAVLKG